MVLTTEVSDNNGTIANNWKFLTEIAPLISPCMGSPQTELYLWGSLTALYNVGFETMELSEALT